MADQQPHHVTVAETGQGPLANLVRVRGHSLPADEPVEAGGGDTGPTPYDYLAAALGCCTNMTLRLYIQHKGLAVTHLECAVAHRKLKDAAGTPRDVFERHIKIEGDLTPDQRDRLIALAKRCPVSLTLERTSTIETRFAD